MWEHQTALRETAAAVCETDLAMFQVDLEEGVEARWRAQSAFSAARAGLLSAASPSADAAAARRQQSPGGSAIVVGGGSGFLARPGSRRRSLSVSSFVSSPNVSGAQTPKGACIAGSRSCWFHDTQLVCVRQCRCVSVNALALLTQSHCHLSCSSC